MVNEKINEKYMANFSISEFIISAVELVEAQADDIIKSFEKSAIGVLSIGVVAAITIVGFIFLLLGINMLFELWVGKPGAYFLTSLVSFIIAFAVYGVVSWKAK